MNLTNNIGILFGGVLRLAVFSYILFDGYTKYNNGESFIISVIALQLFLLSSGLGLAIKILQKLLEATSISAAEALDNIQRKEATNNFQRLLNDMNESKWDLG